MENTNNYKLKIHQISVYTNLEVQLKARTTREEANKEVDRIMGADNLFEGYDWKIEGCFESEINNLDTSLQNTIKERILQEGTEDSIFWNGLKGTYELNDYHIPVNTNLEVGLNSKTKADAVNEAKKMFRDKAIFVGYDWKIEGCIEGGINDFNETLKEEIIKRCENERIEDCIEEIF